MTIDLRAAKALLFFRERDGVSGRVTEQRDGKFIITWSDGAEHAVTQAALEKYEVDCASRERELRGILRREARNAASRLQAIRDGSYNEDELTDEDKARILKRIEEGCQNQAPASEEERQVILRRLGHLPAGAPNPKQVDSGEPFKASVAKHLRSILN